MLAGSNLRANEANAINMMSDEDVAAVMRARSLPPGVAAEEAKANVEGGRLGIQQQEANTRMAAIEDQIAANAEERAQRDREFQSAQEQRLMDRNDRLDMEGRQYEERRAEREAANKERDAANARFMAELEARLRAQDAASRNQQDANDINRREGDARAAALQSKIDAEADARKRAEEMLRRQQLVAEYGPGVEHIIAGQDKSPAAQETLRKIAAESDQNSFGFWQSDAERMNDILKRLDVSDPARRKQFIDQYGFAPDEQAALGPWGGTGRGARVSYWFSPRPSSY
jgi:hypothetical protein